MAKGNDVLYFLTIEETAAAGEVVSLVCVRKRGKKRVDIFYADMNLN